MTITVQADDVTDLVILRAFCLATGWNNTLGVTRRQWVVNKITEWVTQTGRAGYTANAVATIKANYLAALQTASADAQTAVPAPTGGLAP